MDANTSLNRSELTASVLRFFPAHASDAAVKFSQVFGELNTFSLWDVEDLSPDQAKAKLLSTVTMCTRVVTETAKFKLAMALVPSIPAAQSEDVNASLDEISAWARTLRTNCRTFLLSGQPIDPENLLSACNSLDAALVNLQQASMIFALLVRSLAGGSNAAA